MRIKRLKKNAGLSLVEVLIAATILALTMMSLGRWFMMMNQQTLQIKQKAFASQKAVQMMEELRGLISDSSNSSIGVLDDYDDGANYSYILTTKREVTSPGDAVSNNARMVYKRQITVNAISNEPLARRVYVRVFRASTTEPLAETVSIIRTISNRYFPTQVYDVYVLNLENVPGWWVSLSTMKPMFDNVIGDLQTRNPGMEWRIHWITRLAYGRDPHYKPFINQATKTNIVSPTQVYFYPGLMDKPSVGDFEYYIASSISGRINIDGVTDNASSYSIADQYNHAVRYPDEEEMYNEAVTAANTAGTTRPEMSLRMLFEKMNSSPSELMNAMIINLHGELVPLPPMRNYSDPAKDPATTPNIRAVTHPENLSYVAGSAVNLRVYGYHMSPGGVAETSMISTTTIKISNAQLNATDFSVRKLVGNSSTTYNWQNAVNGGATPDYAVTTISSTETLISLYNTPIRQLLHSGSNTGLPTGNRLYGLEYVPSQPSSGTAFQEGLVDLAWVSNDRPKNTARWVIRINAGELANGVYKIETRMGSDYTTGTTINKPANLSRTYVWVGVTAPTSEQYQYMGDPRHMPYSDIKNSFGYNWYFRTVDTNHYRNFSNCANGWHSALNVDIPRYFQTLRQGLMTSNSLWNSMTGFSFYYVGLGGEMGYDGSNGFPSGLPIIQTPWVPTSNANVGVDEITDAQTEDHPRVISNAANTWWGLFWLGELYPDSAYATWDANGNLPVGAGNYYRAAYNAAHVNVGYEPQKRTNAPGCASFFNGNSAGGNAYFQHEYWDSSTGDLTATGQRLDQDFNFPLLAQLTAARPFRLNSTSNAPTEWGNAVYSAIRTTLATMETYYDTTGNTATHDSSALVSVTLGTDVGRVVMNGLSTQTSFGSSQIAKLCTINLLRGFMASGVPSITNSRIPQLPLITISSPTATDEFLNPSSIPVTWTQNWTRYDGQLYTEAYTVGFSEPGAITTNVKYSADNGRTWKFADDGSAAYVGVKNNAYNSTGPYSWAVSSLARGNYILRVEVYRGTRTLHYAYHQVQVYIQR